MSVRPTSRTPDEPASAAIRERTIGILCGLGVVALFSGFTLVSRLGFSSSLTLPDIAALRFGIGGLLLLPIVLRHGLSGLSWRHAIALAFLGGLGFALFAYAGFSLAPAAHGAVLLHGTLPLFTFAITAAIPAAIPGRKATPAKTLGVAMITAGIVVMALDSLLGATAGQLLGDASLLLASVCWASYGILARRLGIPPARAAS
ncbi:MAG TPA: DMT family transporter, partial [Arenibaculum sp.]|nr:DMT family transporter [Arenibaculum sp.]